MNTYFNKNCLKLILFLCFYNTYPIDSYFITVDETKFHLVKSYLCRYGYMNENVCKQHADDSLKFMQNNARDIYRGLVIFQTMFNITRSGKIDEETILKMAKPRCGNKDFDLHFSSSKFLTYKTSDYSLLRRSLNKLTYSIKKFNPYLNRYSKSLPNDVIERMVEIAFNTWLKHLYGDVLVKRLDEHDEQFDSSNITIYFAEGNHGDSMLFDGIDGELAHSCSLSNTQSPFRGHVHLDDSENWHKGNRLLSVLIHQIGHLFGLDHSSNPNSVMSPLFHFGSDGILDEDVKNLRMILGLEAKHRHMEEMLSSSTSTSSSTTTSTSTTSTTTTTTSTTTTTTTSIPTTTTATTTTSSTTTASTTRIPTTETFTTTSDPSTTTTSEATTSINEISSSEENVSTTTEAIIDEFQELESSDDIDSLADLLNAIDSFERLNETFNNLSEEILNNNDEPSSTEIITESSPIMSTTTTTTSLPSTLTTTPSIATSTTTEETTTEESTLFPTLKRKTTTKVTSTQLLTSTQNITTEDPVLSLLEKLIKEMNETVTSNSPKTTTSEPKLISTSATTLNVPTSPFEVESTEDYSDETDFQEILNMLSTRSNQPVKTDKEPSSKYSEITHHNVDEDYHLNNSTEKTEEAVRPNSTKAQSLEQIGNLSSTAVSTSTTTTPPTKSNTKTETTIPQFYTGQTILSQDINQAAEIEAIEQPADLCTDPIVDAITRTEWGNAFIFKGNYIWHIRGLTKWRLFDYDGWPKKISELFPSLPGNIDSAYLYNDQYHFTKNESLWKYKITFAYPPKYILIKGYPRPLKEEYPDIPFKSVDSAFSIASSIFFFKDYDFWQSDWNSNITGRIPFKTSSAVSWRNPRLDSSLTEPLAYIISNSSMYKFNYWSIPISQEALDIRYFLFDCVQANYKPHNSLFLGPSYKQAFIADDVYNRNVKSARQAPSPFVARLIGNGDEANDETVKTKNRSTSALIREEPKIVVGQIFSHSSRIISSYFSSLLIAFISCFTFLF